MAFPYGGSLTHAQLAEKFGWPSVIISILLLLPLWLWSRLVAFPVYLCRKWTRNTTFNNVITYREDKKDGGDVRWKHFLVNTIKYPSSNDVFRQKVYFTRGALPGTTSPMGWDCYIDQEGGKFFESFWGIINCLDYAKAEFDDGRQTSEIRPPLERSQDVSQDTPPPMPKPLPLGSEENASKGFYVFPNSMSWLITMVYCEFPQDEEAFKHRVRFFFPLGGLNYYNIFAWLTMIFVGTALTWYGQRSFEGFKKAEEIVTTSKYFFQEGFDKLPDDMTLRSITNSIMDFSMLSIRSNSGSFFDSFSSRNWLNQTNSAQSYGATMDPILEGSEERSSISSSSRRSMNPRDSVNERASLLL